ncbi:hypothetical protein HY604_00935 [Candidatus Peregrinibacteria bacterium]|nr:hypothetical protein [Candidatus Peregrinibacteria bacterium]
MRKFFAKLGLIIMAAIVISIAYVPLSQSHVYAVTDEQCIQLTGKTCKELEALPEEEQIKLLDETCKANPNCTPEKLKQNLKDIESKGINLSPFLKKYADSEEKSSDEPFIPNNDSLKNLKFDVGKTLSLDSGDQEKSYFSSDNPPIIELILAVIEFATKVIGSIAIIILIIGGFMFMFSQGNEQNLSNAKDVIKYAIIGLIVTFASYIAVLFVQSLFFDANV